MLAFLAVFVGAGLGALLRWGLGSLLNPVFAMVPLGTLAANLTGGFLVGLLAAFFLQHPEVAPEWRLFAITGFLGGLTTFSTFSAEVTWMLIRHEYLWALGSAAMHLGGSLALTGLGIALAQGVLART